MVHSEIHPSHFLSYSTSKIRSLGSKDHNHRFWCACLWKIQSSLRLHFYQLRVSHLPTSWRHKQTFLGGDSTTRSRVNGLFSEWNIKHQFKIWISVITNTNSPYCICRKRDIIRKCIQQGHWEDSTTISFIPRSTENSNTCVKSSLFGGGNWKTSHYFAHFCVTMVLPNSTTFPVTGYVATIFSFPSYPLPSGHAAWEFCTNTYIIRSVYMLNCHWRKIEKKFRLAKAFHQYES